MHDKIMYDILVCLKNLTITFLLTLAVRHSIPMLRRPLLSSSLLLLSSSSTISNNFSSEIALPIKAKFYVEPHLERGPKVYTNGPGHMTKMAAMPIYGKNL